MVLMRKDEIAFNTLKMQQEFGNMLELDFANHIAGIKPKRK